MLSLARCKKGTYEDGTANYTLCCNYAQRRQCKFVHIRGYLYIGTMFTPMQGACENEAKVLVNVKIKTMTRCKKGTYEDGPAIYLYTVTMFAPKEGAYEKEAKVLVSLKM